MKVSLKVMFLFTSTFFWGVGLFFKVLCRRGFAFMFIWGILPGVGALDVPACLNSLVLNVISENMPSQDGKWSPGTHYVNSSTPACFEVFFDDHLGRLIWVTQSSIHDVLVFPFKFFFLTV